MATSNILTGDFLKALKKEKAGRITAKYNKSAQSVSNRMTEEELAKLAVKYIPEFYESDKARNSKRVKVFELDIESANARLKKAVAGNGETREVRTISFKARYKNGNEGTAEFVYYPRAWGDRVGFHNVPYYMQFVE